MAPRRPHASSNANQNPPKHAPRRPESTVPTPNLLSSGATMSDATRYEQNLKIVRRRDPTIVRIFDSFPHVTVYHFDRSQSKWERYGYEGAMFLFERRVPGHQENEPRYGFYILNRSGMNDYVQPIYPWDDLLPQGQYLMINTYPDYTEEMLSATPPSPPPHPADGSVYDPYAARKADGRRSQTIGLWMFENAGRDSLTEVMTRLYGYVKRGDPYPEEFKYEYGRPPSHENDEVYPEDASPFTKSAPTPSILPAQPAQGMTVLDQLFANASRGSAPPAPATSPRSPTQSRRHHAAPSASAIPPPGPTPKPTVDSLFSSVGAHSPARNPAAPAMTTNQANAPAATPATGLALLNSIFASAGATAADPSFQASNGSPTMPRASALQASYTSGPAPGKMNASFRFPNPNIPQSPEQARARVAPAILSPKPTTSGLPPLLYNNIINGSVSSGSRSSSTAPTDRSASSTSSARGSRGFGVNGGPLLDEDAEDQVNSAVRTTVLSAEATPRAGPAGLPPVTGPMSTSGPSLLQQLFSVAETANTNQIPYSSSSVDQTSVRASALADASTLWPTDSSDSTEASDDMIELDFSDTRALADPSVFRSAQAKAKNAAKGKKPAAQRTVQPAAPATESSTKPPKSTPAVQASSPTAPLPTSTIAPAPATATLPSSAAAHSSVPRPTTSSIPMMFVPAQVKQPAKAPPKPVNGVNGLHAPHKSLINGHSPVIAHTVPNSTSIEGSVVNGGLDQDALRGSLIDNLFPAPAPDGLQPLQRLPVGMSRDAFILTLHKLVTHDPHFVDSVWRDYQARVGPHL